MQEKFRHQIFSETRKGSPKKFFGIEMKNFDGKPRYSLPPLIHTSSPPPPTLIRKLFRYRKFSETQKDSSTNCFGNVRQKNFDGESWYPSPSYAWKFPILEFFWNTEGFPYEVFRYRETKKIRQKIVISPS